MHVTDRINRQLRSDSIGRTVLQTVAQKVKCLNSNGSSNTIPWAYPSPQPKPHLDPLSRFAWLTSVTDQPTDHGFDDHQLRRMLNRQPVT